MKSRAEKELKQDDEKDEKKEGKDRPDIMEEIEVEDLTVDGICGVY